MFYSQILPQAPGSAAAARALIERVRAELSQQAFDDARLLVSELVANAVEHAGTMMTVQVARRTRHVHVAVRDGSPAEPMISRESGLTERGRGLMLVEAVSVRWGWLPTDDGKVVWASLCEQAA